MSLQLRPYQQEAVESVFDYWGREPGNPLLDLATGAGKSLILAELVQRLTTNWPDMRVVIATHVGELIKQSYLELIGVWPSAPAGIYSASVGRRDARAQVLFAGIQTVHNKVAQIGFVDVLMIDECHLVPANAETMYGKFIAALREVNPDLKIVGLTATPYRLDSGRLDEGDGRLFDEVVYTYGIGDGIRDGYLAPLSSKGMETGFDLTGVGRQGGDFKQSALNKAVDKDAVNRAAVEEIIRKGEGRRSWLCFCAGVDHTQHIRDIMRQSGIVSEMVTGTTPKGERAEIFEAFKRYEIQALTNCSVATTGFNHKGVDLIAFMRPTLSAGLYLQMAGRGTRPLYAPGADLSTVEGRLQAIADGPKPNCLVLDFAGLVRRHGPVDMVEPKKPGEGGGEAPVKQCKAVNAMGVECGELVHASARVCPACGHEFEFSETPKISATADSAPILSTEEPAWQRVTSQTFRHHDKPGGTPSVRIDYMIGLTVVKTWVCPQHIDKPTAKSKCDRWWKLHGGKSPFPSSVDEFLERTDELLPTAQIKVKYGKYKDVVDFMPGERGDAAPEVEVTVNERWDIDDEIPF